MRTSGAPGHVLYLGRYTVLEFRDPLPVLVAFSLEQVAPVQSRRAPDAQKFSSPPDLNTHAARTHARGPSVRRPAPRVDHG